MTTMDSSPTFPEMKATAVRGLLSTSVDTCSARLADSIASNVGGLNNLDATEVRDMLDVVVQTAGLLGEMCTELLLSRHTAGFPAREHLQVAQDAAEALVQHCRWAGRHVT